MVTFPIAGTYIEALSFTWGSKFCDGRSVSTENAFKPDAQTGVRTKTATYLFSRKVDTYCTFFKQLGREFE